MPDFLRWPLAYQQVSVEVQKIQIDVPDAGHPPDARMSSLAALPGIGRISFGCFLPISAMRATGSCRD